MQGSICAASAAHPSTLDTPVRISICSTPQSASMQRQPTACSPADRSDQLLDPLRCTPHNQILRNTHTLISLCSSMVGYHCRLYFCMELRINYKSVENLKFYFKVFCVTCCCTTTISPIHRITFTKLYITCRNCHNNLIHSLTLVFAQHCVRGNRSVNICALSQKI